LVMTAKSATGTHKPVAVNEPIDGRLTALQLTLRLDLVPFS